MLMMKRDTLFFIAFALILFMSGSCSNSTIGELTGTGNLTSHRYAYVSPTTQTTSGFCVNGHVTASVFNPSDMISAEFICRGFVVLPVLPDSTLLPYTIIVNYGEKSVRKSGDRYAADVVIQSISAADYSVIMFGEAVEYGDSEIEAKRIAVENCLRKMFRK